MHYDQNGNILDSQFSSLVAIVDIEKNRANVNDVEIGEENLKMHSLQLHQQNQGKTAMDSTRHSISQSFSYEDTAENNFEPVCCFLECELPDIPPIACTTVGCKKFLHRTCQSVFIEEGGYKSEPCRKCIDCIVIANSENAFFCLTMLPVVVSWTNSFFVHEVFLELFEVIAACFSSFTCLATMHGYLPRHHKK